MLIKQLRKQFIDILIPYGKQLCEKLNRKYFYVSIDSNISINICLKSDFIEFVTYHGSLQNSTKIITSEELKEFIYNLEIKNFISAFRQSNEHVVFLEKELSELEGFVDKYKKVKLIYKRQILTERFTKTNQQNFKKT